MEWVEFLYIESPSSKANITWQPITINQNKEYDSSLNWHRFTLDMNKNRHRLWTKITTLEAPEFSSCHGHTEYIAAHRAIPIGRDPETEWFLHFKWQKNKSKQVGKFETHSHHKPHLWKIHKYMEIKQDALNNQWRNWKSKSNNILKQMKMRHNASKLTGCSKTSSKRIL